MHDRSAVIDLERPAGWTGTDLIAAEVHAVWRTTHTEATIETALAAGLPTP